MDPLDNPVWHALTGPQAKFGQGSALAKRYDPEVGVFAGIPDDGRPAAWDELATLVGRGRTAALVRLHEPELASGWTDAMRLPTLQMVAARRIGAVDGELDAERDETLVGLGARDRNAMIALTERTRPGPFFARTHELGYYVGVRDGDGLIAMAGERMRTPTYTEISAVCTDPSARGRGLATRCVQMVAAGIEARGETPILHVLAENENAIRLYKSLGFEVRAAFDVVIARPPK
jgi:ribosomal protein S18 acetylase RimI-like enzyme